MSVDGIMLLGLDGGGSSTTAWLAEPDDAGQVRIVGRGTSGPSNCRTMGLSAATNNLRHAIESAFDQAGRPIGPLTSACLTLAGADRPDEQNAIRSWAEEIKLTQHLVITNDAMPVLYAATRDGIGIALISGTGSVALGRNAEGQLMRCGGWGPLLGDEGSGYKIAVLGLQSAARDADGRGPHTMLLKQFLRRFNISEASELIPVVYSDQMSRAKIAGIATIVFEAAESGDTVAEAIITRSAVDLSALVITIAERLRMTDTVIELGVSGGVLLNQSAFVESIVQRLRSSGLQLSVQRVENPVAGAVAIAHQQLNH